MQGFNHVAGGLVFTGIFASFADQNIYEKPETLLMTIGFSLLPDIDHTKSIIGKSVYPLSQWIMRKYGHRTITHSLIFWIICVMLVQLIDNLFHRNNVLIAALSLGSHLIFDMCTRQGIPIFYPFSKRPAVLPANPKLRLQAGDFRSEAIIFVAFISLNAFSFDLVANGFWTKYNRKFMTFNHLEREMRHKPFDYEIKFFDGKDTLTEFVQSLNGQRLITYSDKFNTYDTDILTLIDFQMLKTKHKVKDLSLFEISVDSLNRVAGRYKILKMVIQSKEEIYYFNNSIMKKGTEFDLVHEKPQFYEVLKDNSEIELKLKLLEIQRLEEIRRYDFEIEYQKSVKDKLLKIEEKKEIEPYLEGLRRKEVSTLRNEINNFRNPYPPNLSKYDLERMILEKSKIHKNTVSATLKIWTL
jgi:inner membrane protein